MGERAFRSGRTFRPRMVRATRPAALRVPAREREHDYACLAYAPVIRGLNLYKGEAPSITDFVRRLRLILSLFCSLFFVVIFSCVFLRRRWVEVRLRASLKRALDYSQSGHTSTPRLFYRTRCFSFSTTTKLQSSNVIMSRV
jgi:hypothetical protein